MKTDIAIVGMAIRAPGRVDDVDDYWTAIAAGRDLIGDLPDDRRGPFGAEWDGMVTRGGYLPAPFDFDAKFFGVSPREARVMDPQQRLLLEVVWEAFEDAALPPGVVGPSTGVFVGITGQDYRRWFDGQPGSHWTAGNGLSFAAGRLSHALGLQGPSLAVDTACSSSLTALHSACRALADGECEVAVAAGVNLILAPWTSRALSTTGALSPVGMSRPFDEQADGYVRGEGCGAVVLKRRSEAERDNDRILAVIEGTALNHDGRAVGFAAPNAEAQGELMRSLLSTLGIEPGEIGYHEAHGTGTQLGDAAEVKALVAALGGRRNSPLHVGSVKANVGHAEAAAGIMGLIKAVLCRRHRVIPPQPNLRTVNPNFELDGAQIAFSTTGCAWDASMGEKASVSSFGMSGTNAYAVVSVPAVEPAPPAPRPVEGFAVSARTTSALRRVATGYAARLHALSPADYAAFAYTATHGRSRLENAVWIEAPDPASAGQALAAAAAGEEHPRIRPLGPSQPLPSQRPRQDAERAVVSLPTYPWERSSYAVKPLGADG